MPLLTSQKFSFVSMALPGDAFGVVNFKGSEGLSALYEFDVTLVSQNPEIDLAEVLENPAVFTILREDGDIPFHGILAKFEQLQEVDEYVFYRAVLVPKLWWLSLTHHNQVFLNMTIPQIIEAVLKDGGLSDLDYELRLEKDYPEWEYVCQYRESHFDFLSRKMERDGIYYYFEQTPNGEKVVITDTVISHTAMPEGKTMHYSPPSGLEEPHLEEVILAFLCSQQMLPRKLMLKDYNYETPSLEITGEAEVLANGRGDVFLYGDHFRTPEEGKRLAKIRAEEYLCRERRFFGDSTIPFVRPGYVFDLVDHYRSEFNQSYLTLDAKHEGSQTSYLASGIRNALSEIEETLYYRNSFTAIPSGVQFRPERKTEKARIYGAMNARVDAAGSGKYAELDEQGRYKIILPFDLSGRKDGKASAWLRMVQPYAGSDHGMHFPLHKGAEVLITFIDGDPDRPVIAGAVPNPENPSLVSSENQTKCMITTGGQNKIHMEDQQGSERILMQSHKKNTWARLGTPNDPPASAAADSGSDDKNIWQKSPTSAEGFAFHTDGSWGLDCLGDANININGMMTEIIVWGAKNELTLAGNSLIFVAGGEEKIILGAKVDFHAPEENEFSPEKNKAAIEKLEASVNEIKTHGEQIKMTGNKTLVDGAKDEAVGAVTRAIGEDTALRAALTDLIEDHTWVIEMQLKTVGSRVAAVASDVKNVASEVKDLGTSITNAGQSIADIGMKISDSGTSVEDVGSAITDAGALIMSAGIITME